MTSPAHTSAPYDALLLLSFGGPEGPEDVLPFLENVTRGRNIPRERLEEVGEHYYLFGGVSPINQQCRDLKAAIEADFAAHAVELPVYWGNRNWTPYLADTVRQMRADGIRRAAAFVTSAYSGYSTNDQYLEDIERAREEVPDAPVIDKLPVYCDRPGFLEPFADAAQDALNRLPEDARLVFTAHSVPLDQPNRELYVAELETAARTVASKAAPGKPWDLVYQSRSGPPTQPWLEPQITDHLEKLSGEGVRAVAVVPIGFVSDHMEVKFDLDVEAAERAAELGVAFARAATPGNDPRFAALPRHLLADAT
ncbi:ferrochelatase [Actinomadura spongiicola]|uniref:Coproporphyrin III ferrochelatase n=1 Tax=Actinomadura spongiicola TaxID=2303421 RepID=A0A372G982_9ACTN|nr:ferrochelatase [Actinomadura spongiicola]RFS81702.1 ferrochelatase [Actinomadura spongiicola]